MIDLSCGFPHVEYRLPFRRAPSDSGNAHGRAHGTRTVRAITVSIESADVAFWRMLREHFRTTAGAFQAKVASFPDPLVVQYESEPSMTPINATRVSIQVALEEALATGAAF